MQTLTKADVVTACRQALADGTLIAQNRKDPAVRTPSGKIKYGYDLGQFRCAVGAALTRETLDFINRPHGHRRSLHLVQLRGLIEHEAVCVPLEDFDAISDIQRAHDVWNKTGRASERESFESLLR
jgi:hypothetical protein